MKEAVRTGRREGVAEAGGGGVELEIIAADKIGDGDTVIEDPPGIRPAPANVVIALPVAGVPNAAHLIHYLKAYGFDEIAINVHYLAETIVAALGDGSRFGVKLHYSYEPELLGSAGGVKKVEDFFGDETFVVIGCDEITDLRLDRLLEFHRDRGAVATIGLVHREEVEQYGVVVVDERGKIVGFQEKPAKGTERSKLVNTGVYVFSPRIFERIPADQFYDFGSQVFPAMKAADEQFYGFDARGAYWADIGTPERIPARKLRCGERRRADTANHAKRHRSHGEAEEGVRIEGPVRIGAGVSVGEGMSISWPERSRRSRARGGRRTSRAHDLLGGRNHRRARGPARHHRGGTGRRRAAKAFSPMRWSRAT